jgi:hypothetical protein
MCILQQSRYSRSKATVLQFYVKMGELVGPLYLWLGKLQPKVRATLSYTQQEDHHLTFCWQFSKLNATF